MSSQLDDAALLAAELLARRWLPRQHPKVKRALIDADLWAATQDRLAQVGLRLIDNLYADHVSVALLRPAETTVFGEAGLNSHNNIDLPRDAVSLLVVLWSLIVLPKRERQAARAANAQGDDQNDMFGKDRPLPTAASVSQASGREFMIGRITREYHLAIRADCRCSAASRVTRASRAGTRSGSTTTRSPSAAGSIAGWSSARTIRQSAGSSSEPPTGPTSRASI